MLQFYALFAGVYWRFAMYLGALCNGSTAVFGTVDPGSNPGSPAKLSEMIELLDEDSHPGLQPNNRTNEPRSF